MILNRLITSISIACLAIFAAAVWAKSPTYQNTTQIPASIHDPGPGGDFDRKAEVLRWCADKRHGGKRFTITSIVPARWTCSSI